MTDLAKFALIILTMAAIYSGYKVFEDWFKTKIRERKFRRKKTRTGMSDMLINLKAHLSSTSKEDLQKEWAEIKAMGLEGPTVDEFMGIKPQTTNIAYNTKTKQFGVIVYTNHEKKLSKILNCGSWPENEFVRLTKEQFEILISFDSPNSSWNNPSKECLNEVFKDVTNTQ